MAFHSGSLTPITLPTNLPDGLPKVFDDTSLAFSLGLRCRTLWWLICTSTIDHLDLGTGSYLRFTMPKSSGGTRLIYAPRKTLKRVQRVLLHTYFDPIPVGDWVGAYVQGRDMVYSVNKHVGKDVVIGMDLSDFFGSTKRSWVREWLAELGFPPAVVYPLSGLLCAPVRYGPHPEDEEEGAPDSRPVRWMVPQGAPTSGAVTNHVATRRLDIPLMAMLERQGLHDLSYTRYADDLTISYNGFLARENFHELLNSIKQVIRDSGYRPNRQKTRVMVSRPGRPIPQRMLGMSIREKMNVPREKRRRLRARVHDACTSRVSDSEAILSLKAELAYWARIAPHTIIPLQEKLSERYA